VNNAPAASNLQKPQDVSKAMERLQNLEKLVKELSGQLEQAHATQRDSTSPAASTITAATVGSVQHELGRLVLQDTEQSRYITSGFGSKVNDEVWNLLIKLILSLAGHSVPHTVHLGVFVIFTSCFRTDEITQDQTELQKTPIVLLSP
jgi:hypothetical protein